MDRQTPFDFFYQHAGYSYATTETPEQGRTRCARELVEAERAASDAGCCYEWARDDLTSDDWTTEAERLAMDGNPEPWSTWCCLMMDADGEVVQSLCGIDFGRDGDPWGQPYRRVVEAELAQCDVTVQS